MFQGTDPFSRIVVALVGLVVALRISDLALQVTLLGLVEVQQTCREALKGSCRIGSRAERI